MKALRLAMVLGLAFVAQAGADQSGVSYKVLGAEDGDTLLVEIDGTTERVQISGIDAPEDKENAKFKLDMQKTGLTSEVLMEIGMVATAHLGTLTPEGGAISLQGDLASRDKYGRIPAIVINADGENVAERMVRDGYAIALAAPSLEEAYFRRLDRLEKFSRKAGNGLWSSHTETVQDWYNRTR